MEMMTRARRHEATIGYAVAVIMTMTFIAGSCSLAQQRQIRHGLVVSDVALFKACEAVRAGLDEAYAAKAITQQQYQDARTKLATVYDAGGAFTAALQAWHPGSVVPASMADLARAIADVRRVLLSLPASAQRDKIIDVLGEVDGVVLALLAP